TIKYALERPTKKVYINQLNVDSPYNTYKRYGLPPGPICNPGIESIRAAVYPAETNYYFFVANKDGSHIFTRNNDEHLKARRSVR
ncbi:MAG: endolytic transglycosylase MltG, partial [bacterium]